jgi:hypothetical protein
MNRRLGDVQQQRIGQCLRIDHERFVHEHHGFAEGLALPEDVDDLLPALRRGECQFHLAVDNQVEAGRRVALVEQDVAARPVISREPRARRANFSLFSSH